MRRAATAPWNVWRGFIALGYLAAAVFNAVYTVPRVDTDLEGFADGAWFGFLADFMREVFIPNGVMLMILVIVFEVGVALLISSRGRAVDLGIWSSLAWVVAILPFLPWPHLLTNIALIAMQGVLLLRKYDSTLPSFVAGLFGPHGAPLAR